jgi:hypothetical protein
LDWIGVQDGTCYATDRYSIGIAVFREHPGLLAPFHLPLSEAKDMVRWLKPVKVNQRKDSIRAEVHGLELHIGIESFEDETLTTEIYELYPPGEITLQSVRGQVLRIAKDIRNNEPVTVLPQTVDRFVKAAEIEGDRMRLYPTGYAAVVTVGNNFLGAVSQLKDIPGYGDRSLLDWGIG